MKAFLLLLILPVQVLAQDITGVWTGCINTMGNELPYELVISKNDEKFGGYSLTTFTIDGVENWGMKSMKIKAKNGKITIEDDELVDDNYSIKAKRMMLYSVMNLTRQDSSLILTGTFNSRSYNNPTYKGTIVLRKKSNFSQTKLMAKLGQMNLLQSLSFMQPVKEKEKVIVSSSTAVKDPEPKKGNQFAVKTPPPVIKKEQPSGPVVPAANLAKRKIEIIQTIFFSSDSLVLSLYDNGQVDGDTVSVIWNGQTIIQKEGLTTKAIHKTIYTGSVSADSVQLVMYAENLGLIPPNTGLLIIQDGDKRYEVRFSGDLQRNSAINFKRRR